MTTNPDFQIDKLLTLSVEQYRKVLQHTENIVETFDGCDYSEVDEQVLVLEQLQAEACQQDKQLLPLLRDRSLVSWKEDERYQIRLDYINSILNLNELLVPKIRGIMAVTSVELKKVCSGRNALTGYASQASREHSLRGVG